MLLNLPFTFNFRKHLSGLLPDRRSEAANLKEGSRDTNNSKGTVFPPLKEETD